MHVISEGRANRVPRKQQGVGAHLLEQQQVAKSLESGPRLQGLFCKGALFRVPVVYII